VLSAAGIPTYGINPIFLGPDDGNVHGRNEYIAVHTLLQAREFLYRLVKVYAETRSFDLRAPAALDQGASGMGATSTEFERSSDRGNPLLGTWRLESLTTVYQDNGEKVEFYGAHPTGFLSYGADGRMYVILVSQGRVAPTGDSPRDEEKVALFNGMVAYAGSYEITGDSVQHHVDISWIQSWTGSTQVRTFRIDGDRLYLQSPPAKDFTNGRVSTATIVWTRIR
jgi:hypothetical protein